MRIRAKGGGHTSQIQGAPEILRYKPFEPILLLGRNRFAGVEMRIRVKGGRHTSQIYAIRQSIAKALVVFYQKYVDEQSKKEIKDIGNVKMSECQ
ncbi:hypothetical protein ACS0TY_001861 [Phlomoides rotata]